MIIEKLKKKDHIIEGIKLEFIEVLGVEVMTTVKITEMNTLEEMTEIMTKIREMKAIEDQLGQDISRELKENLIIRMSNFSAETYVLLNLCVLNYFYFLHNLLLVLSHKANY